VGALSNALESLEEPLPTIELVPLAHLDPASYNPRKISEQQLDASLAL
jgi:hypothetical protein